MTMTAGSTLTALLLLVCVQQASASVCVVSFWSPWGPCIGNCQFGLAVRNRDVMRPPFPERTPDGRLAIRACPPLYQVQTCVPTPCLQGLTDFSGISLTAPNKTAPDPNQGVVDNAINDQDVLTIAPAVANTLGRGLLNNAFADNAEDDDRAAVLSDGSGTRLNDTPEKPQFMLGVNPNDASSSSSTALPTSHTKQPDPTVTRAFKTPFALKSDQPTVTPLQHNSTSAPLNTTAGTLEETLSIMSEFMDGLNRTAGGNDTNPLNATATSDGDTFAAFFFTTPEDSALNDTTTPAATANDTTTPAATANDTDAIVPPFDTATPADNATAPEAPIANSDRIAPFDLRLPNDTFIQHLDILAKNIDLVAQNDSTAAPNDTDTAAWLPAKMRLIPFDDQQEEEEGLAVLQALANNTLDSTADNDSLSIAGRRRGFLRGEERQRMTTTARPASQQRQHGPKPLTVVLGNNTVDVDSFQEAEQLMEQERLRRLEETKRRLRIRDLQKSQLVNQPTGPCGVTSGPNGLQCCRKPMRILCPDGSRPQIVMRFFRNEDSRECQSYSYPYCGYEQEQADGPIKWEEDCYQLCYTPREKATLSVFDNIRFEDGYRTVAYKNRLFRFHRH